MKKVLLTSLIVMMVAGTTFANPEGIPHGAKMIGHLNIIGVKNTKSDNMDNKGGGVIFVDLYGKNKIYLVQSGTEDAPGTDDDDFAVLDKNATDRDGALLALPDPDLDPYWVEDPEPDPELDTESAYSVFVRPRGTPGGKAKITTCAQVNESGLFAMLPGSDKKEIKNWMDDEEIAYCSVQQVGHDILTRNTGKSKFTNVTAELLTIVFQIDLIMVIDDVDVVVATYHVRVPIFDDLLSGEFWYYDNEGLKNCEVRFYAIPTNVADADATL